MLALAAVPAAAARKPAPRPAPAPAPANPNVPLAKPPAANPDAPAANPNAPASPSAASASPAASPSTAPAAAPAADDGTPDPLADRVIFYEYTHHVRPKEFNFSLGGGFNNLGLALWFAIPVVPDGLLPDVNDQLNVEVGLIAGLFRDQLYGLPDPYQAWTLAVSGGLRWDFHVTQAWVPYALLKIAVNFGFHQIVLPGGGLGVLYRLTDDWRLRLELGFPLGISAGLTFDLPAL